MYINIMCIYIYMYIYLNYQIQIYIVFYIYIQIDTNCVKHIPGLVTKAQPFQKTSMFLGFFLPSQVSNKLARSGGKSSSSIKA